MSIPFGVTIPFIQQMLGFTLEVFEGGKSVLHFRPKAEHCNSFRVVHGGAVMTLLDVAMATAARSAMPSDTGVVTIEMKTSFMRPTPAQNGEQLVIGEGRLLHRTRSTAFVEGRVLDQDGNLCAMATGTFRYVPRAAGAEARPVATD